MSRSLLLATLLLTTGFVTADNASEANPVAPAAASQAANGPEKPSEDAETGPRAGADQGPKVVSGMSILGNQEAPKSLVIVPWKSSELGESLAISAMLDDSKQPVDKEVFLRALIYYQIRAEKKP